MADRNTTEVALTGDQLERVLAAQDAVDRSISAMRSLIVESMEGTTERVDRGTDGVAFSSPSTLVVHGPEYCYVYDGAAGVCRPCTPAEESGLETMVSE